MKHFMLFINDYLKHAEIATIAMGHLSDNITRATHIKKDSRGTKDLNMTKNIKNFTLINAHNYRCKLQKQNLTSNVQS